MYQGPLHCTNQPLIPSTHRPGDVAQLSNIQASSRAGKESLSELPSSSEG